MPKGDKGIAKEGFCTECGAELLNDLCPTPGCFGLPLSVLSSNDRAMVVQSQTEEAAKSLIPYITGQSRKFQYLAYRYAGFSMVEAMVRYGVEKGTLNDWRATDPKFRIMEAELGGPNRVAIRKELMSLVFLRTYHLAQLKDLELFEKDSREGVELTDFEKKRLLDARKYYTPQTLEAIDRLTSVRDENEGEYTEVMLRIRKYISKGGIGAVVEGSMAGADD